MIDIYDEIGYIKNILQDGLSEKWERDLKLLVRYYKSIGYKRSQAEKEALYKCEHNNGKFEYNNLTSYKRFKAVFNKGWTSKDKLREIRYIDISKEVLDWFLSLEDSVILTDEQVEIERKKRKGLVIKNNKAFNWNRVKFLFSLYIWTRIQENYVPNRPDIHYLNSYVKRFKQDANLNPGFNFKRERNYLYDLGYIGINYSLGVEAKFIKDNEVFSIPITDENRVRINLLNDIKDKNGNILKEEVGDIHNCGYWLEKQKMGWFVCQCCGREIANYKKVGRGQPRKYCKNCERKTSNNGNSEKIIHCIDCGKEIKVTTFVTSQCRCINCQEKYRQNYKKIKQREYRISHNVDIAFDSILNPQTLDT